MEKSKNQKGKFRKFTPHKALNEGWRYFKFQGSDQVVAMRSNIVKAFFVVEEGGELVLTPQSKQHIHEWDFAPEVKLLTLDEYDEIKKSGWDN